MDHDDPTSRRLVNRPERLDRLAPMGPARFVRLADFLARDVAEAAQDELGDDRRYPRRDGDGPPAPGPGPRFGALRAFDGSTASGTVLACCDLLRGAWLAERLSTLAGRPVAAARPGVLYRMEYGDRICLHDDLTDPGHRLAVVLNLSRGWRREFGGNTVIGRVRAVEQVDGASKRWVLGRSRSVLTPAFNTLTVLRLGRDLAHAVTPVRVHRARLSIATIFGDAGPA